jgi:hypothetical protein
MLHAIPESPAANDRWREALLLLMGAGQMDV